MYIPKHFAPTERALVVEVMRSHAFAVMVSDDDRGAPFERLGL